jgi:hypothetical protein
MAIRAGMSLLEMIAQLTRGFVKSTGRQPGGLEKIKIKQEAVQRFKDMNKVVDMQGRTLDPSKIIMGGTQEGAALKSGIMKATGAKPIEARVDISKYIKDGKPDNDKLNALVDRDIILKEEADSLATTGRNYERFQKILAERKNIREIIEDVRNMFLEKKAGGGRTGLSYLLAEDTNERMPFFAGKVVKGGNWLLKTLRGTREAIKNSKDYPPEQINLFLKQIDDQIKSLEAGGPIPDEVIQTIRKDPKFKSVWQNQKSLDPDLREMEEVLLEYGQKHAEGGITRMPFSMGRRAFLKLMGGVGAGIGALKTGALKMFGKEGATVAKEVTSVPIGNPEGMPSWFKPLVNKVIKEGEDVTKKFATKEREIVHTKKLGDPKADDVYADEVTVTQDLDTGNVRVEYHSSTNMGEAPIQLEYKASEVIEPNLKTGKGGGKTKEEFTAVESEPRVANWDGDIEWDGENVVGKVDELLSDTTQLEAYATGKRPTIKKLLKSEEKQKKVQRLHEDQGNQIDYIETKYGPGPDPTDFDDWPTPEYASGGLAKMLGE